MLQGDHLWLSLWLLATALGLICAWSLCTTPWWRDFYIMSLCSSWFASGMYIIFVRVGMYHTGSHCAWLKESTRCIHFQFADRGNHVQIMRVGVPKCGHSMPLWMAPHKFDPQHYFEKGLLYHPSLSTVFDHYGLLVQDPRRYRNTTPLKFWHGIWKSDPCIFPLEAILLRFHVKLRGCG